jgi:hypothetical protein
MFHLWPAWDTDIVLDLPCTPADLARVIEDEAPEWAPLPDNTSNVWRWRIDGARQTVWRAPGCGWLQALATPDGARLEVFLPHVLVYPYGATIARRAWHDLQERLIDLGWLVEDEEDKPARDEAIEKHRARGTSAATDADARQAARLYAMGLTEAQIAERMTVSERTVKRWRKRVRDTNT